MSNYETEQYVSWTKLVEFWIDIVAKEGAVVVAVGGLAKKQYVQPTDPEVAEGMRWDKWNTKRKATRRQRDIIENYTTGLATVIATIEAKRFVQMLKNVTKIRDRKESLPVLEFWNKHVGFWTEQTDFWFNIVEEKAKGDVVAARKLKVIKRKLPCVKTTDSLNTPTALRKRSGERKSSQKIYWAGS